MRYWAIILSIFGLDMGIKNYIEKQKDLETQDRRIGNFLLLRKYHNKGMAMNIGEKRQKTVVLLSLVLTAAVTVLFIITLGNKGNALLRTGLAFLLGGAFSNTYDRLRRKYVIDYVSFNVPGKRLRNIIFNIADFSIVIGALFIVLST